jgi:hypothetical protein
MVNYNDQKEVFYLRKLESINKLNFFRNHWEFYIRNFKVFPNMSESESKINLSSYERLGISNIEGFRAIQKTYKEAIILFSFKTTGEVAAIFKHNDLRNLSQIEQMNGYSVKSNGVVSQFKLGGCFVYEKDGHGLVVSLVEFNAGELTESVESFNQEKAIIKFCENLTLNGYDDWRLPTKSELSLIYQNLAINKIAGFYNGDPNEVYSGRPGNHNTNGNFRYNCYFYLQKKDLNSLSFDLFEYKSGDYRQYYVPDNNFSNVKLRVVRSY